MLPGLLLQAIIGDLSYADKQSLKPPIKWMEVLTRMVPTALNLSPVLEAQVQSLHSGRLYPGRPTWCMLPAGTR